MGDEVDPHEGQEELYARQCALEEKMVGIRADLLSKACAEAQDEGKEADTIYGKLLIRNGVNPLAAHLRTKHNEVRRGPRPIEKEVLDHLSMEMVAFLTLKYALANISVPTKLTAISIALGKSIEKEAKAARLAVKRPGVVKVLDPLKSTDHVKLGDYLLGEAEGLLHFFKKETVPGENHQQDYLVIEDDKAEWITECLRKEIHFHPTYLPMCMKPQDWTTPFDGGYVSNKEMVEPLSLVKMKWQADTYFEELSSRGMPVVYAAVNALQRTAWKINKRVFGVFEEAVRKELPIGGLPTRKSPTFTGDSDERKQQKDEHTSRLIEVARIQQSAEICVKEARFYFPYALDFRGRAYAVPSYLNPQGNDIAKALLTFAEGKPLGTQRAADWLAIHGANLFGQDKEPLEARIKWTHENTPKILEVAADPMHNSWWPTNKAKKRWQFLAFCFEWAGYKAEGLDFKSSLPIAIDGSCNGLQHYSAMLRDSEGGRMVNLMPLDHAEDIYKAVSDKLVKKLEDIRDNDKEEPRRILARQWLAFGISRDTTKKTVMTMPYNVTEDTSLDHLEDYIREHAIAVGPPPFTKRKTPKNTSKGSRPGWRFYTQATRFLAKPLWVAIGETVEKAIAAQSWLKDAAKAHYKVLPDCSITWFSPTQFPASQKCPDFSTLQVETKFNGSMRRPRLREESEIYPMDKRDMIQGLAPNFIHSLDSAHMMLTIQSCLTKGVTSFAMIHDSYASHASAMDSLLDATRTQFYEMYNDHDVLNELRDTLNEVLGGDVVLRPVPERGTLDLSGVLQSVFFFS